MRQVTYRRHEFRYDPEERTAGLADFLLDVPHLVSYGVIPHLQLLNDELNRGGGDAGMSPGTSWEPFQINEEEYRELVDELLSLDVERGRAEGRFRFARENTPLRTDSGLEWIKDRFAWLRATREKYGTRSK